MSAKKTGMQDSAIVQLTASTQARARLVCLHHAGGAASAFRSLAAALAEWPVDVCAMQLPGRETRFSDPLHVSMHDIIAEQSNALNRLSALPTVLLGHSMGAIVAYRLAQNLRQSPIAVLVSGARAPDDPGRASGRGAHDDHALMASMQALGGLPPALQQQSDFMKIVIRNYRADLTALDSDFGRPCPPLSCPLLVLGARDDSAIPESALAFWRNKSSSGVLIDVFDGGHFFIYRRVDRIAAVVRRLLSELRLLSAQA